jgi:imidazolonepropionase-like amidohydrolase
MRLAIIALLAATHTTALLAQGAAQLSQQVRPYVRVDSAVVALTNVRVIDGTGAAQRDNQTIVISNGKISAVGRAGQVRVPAGAQVLDLAGHTVIPGLVGMHNHLFYTAAGGRRAQLNFSAPRLYLASGVTTIRTTGSTSPYADINLKAAIDSGNVPGPRIFITAPYITGGDAPGQMARIESPEQARRFVAYWAEEGATWIKAYTDIRRAELQAAIEEAHRRGLKVTGHLCSVSFTEAVGLGIDNLEHGLLTASDFVPAKVPDACPASLMRDAGTASASSATAQATIRALVDRHVSMTSTLAVYEPFFPGRPTKDQRTLDAMAPEVRDAYLRARHQIDSAGAANPDYPLKLSMLQNAMAFEKAFFDAGGLLAAGVDPTGIGGALPGYGDQRNYEMLIEGGFTPAQAVQVVSANGARILGIHDRVGSIEVGKVADLVVLNGDLAADRSVIRNVTIVFKGGIGYDAAKLIESVKGRVGIS